ncbi:hypothetical protein [Burkholderia sp. F1]|uniref:hypothetical protein n=1 Tax=Burkholderia sp. F1 TaxID=3366817 RepID=UPI003D722CF3
MWPRQLIFPSSFIGGVLAERFGFRVAFAGFAVTTLLLIAPFLRIATRAAALHAEKPGAR